MFKTGDNVVIKSEGLLGSIDEVLMTTDRKPYVTIVGSKVAYDLEDVRLLSRQNDVTAEGEDGMINGVPIPADINQPINYPQAKEEYDFYKDDRQEEVKLEALRQSVVEQAIESNPVLLNVEEVAQIIENLNNIQGILQNAMADTREID